MSEEKSHFCNCLYFSANSLARNLSKLAEESFVTTGLAPSYAFTLIAVNRSPGITPSEIAREMHMMPSTITRFLDKLELKGYVLRKTEGKKSLVYPTNKSVGLNEQLLKAWQKIFNSYAALLGESRSSELASEIYNASETIKKSIH